ncbi:MAG: peptidoglycan DD-metalloendopeptidase family protein [Pseudomonadales bacterium]|nr:peptidoglycan DD-metalloendopeptidase family protein [Pseudomonadales bacterium]
MALCLVGGCASSSPIPVVERVQPPTEKINTHWVSEGDTLYAIAWRYNLDAEQLAAANGLDQHKRIARGQVLRLDVAQALRERRASERRAPRTTLAARSQRAAQPAAQQRSAPTLVAKQPVAGAWQWPAQGRLLKRFSAAARTQHKGLDIGGVTGQRVVAAQNGTVVYAGDGLAAYGNLLIVKHADNYLSAYAHNSRLLVREGERVSAGQIVAEMGRSGTSHDHLHFEIRKRGVPVNPLAILPKASAPNTKVAAR